MSFKIVKIALEMQKMGLKTVIWCFIIVSPSNIRFESNTRSLSGYKKVSYLYFSLPKRLTMNIKPRLASSITLHKLKVPLNLDAKPHLLKA